MPRFVDRPHRLGGTDVTPPSMALASDWGRHRGKRIDRVRARDQAEFRVGH